MATRKIKVLSTVGVSGTIETNVSTLGELKPLLSAREINFSGMKIMVGETRNELTMDEAVLPEGDFKLYLMPQKTKSGGELSSKLYSLAEKLTDIADELEEVGQELAEGSCCKGSQVNYGIDPDLEDLRAVQNGTAGPGSGLKKSSSWLD